MHTARNENLGGRPDEQILALCREGKRVLITLDLDFSDIRLYPTGTHEGIWVLRPESQSIDRILALLEGALTLLETEPHMGRLWVVEHGRVRIKG